MIDHRGYKITAEKTRTGYGAEIQPNPGIAVAGDTKNKTIRLAREAIDLWLEYAPMSFEEAMKSSPRVRAARNPWQKTQRSHASSKKKPASAKRP